MDICPHCKRILTPDRDAYGMTEHERGAWISGFTAGEGCFRLGRKGDSFYAKFIIMLRADDGPILRTIGNAFGTDNIRQHKSNGTGPTARLEMSHSRVLANVIVKHFDRYSLWVAKKSYDYKLWRRAVEILHDASTRPHRGNMFGKGISSRLSPSEIDELAHLHASLGTVKKYNGNNCVSDFIKTDDQRYLFDLIGYKSEEGDPCENP